MQQLIIVNVNDMKIILQDASKTVRIIEPIYIGKKGVTKDKKEGDMKTPLGKFKIGIAFGIEDLFINYPYLKITKNSYWVDDIYSPFYNMWVEINGKLKTDYPYITNSEKKNWNSAEHLIDYSAQYKKGFVIEYNTGEAKKAGKGSAIFFHIKKDSYTAGCIAVSEEDMEYIINWLDKNKDPHIIIEKV